MNASLVDKLWGLSIRASGALAVLALLGILGVLSVHAATAFAELGFGELLGSSRWMPDGYEEDRFGLLSMIASSLLVTLGAMLLAVPVGVGTAAYLSELAPTWLREVLKPAIELLAAIPSVVVGFIGLTVVAPVLATLLGTNHGLTAANGSLLLALMALPTIVTLSEDAIGAVPREWREGSYALGAGRFETLWRVVLPGARSGVVAAIMLGVGRAIGETMTVLMVTGNAVAFPTGLTESVRTLTATIAIEMGETAAGSTHYHALFAVGLVLLLITILINSVADRLGRAGGRR